MPTHTRLRFDDLVLPDLGKQSRETRISLDGITFSAPVEEPETPDAPAEPLPQWEPDESPRIEPDPEDIPIPHPSPAIQPGTEPVPDRIPTFCPWKRSERGDMLSTVEKEPFINSPETP